MRKRFISMLLALALTISVLPAVAPLSVAAAGYDSCERVVYFSEDFEDLEEGDIDGQGNWTADQQPNATAEVIYNNDSKALSFYRREAYDSQSIIFTPTIDEDVSVGANERLSVSFDYMTEDKVGDSARHFMFELGDGNKITFNPEAMDTEVSTSSGNWLDFASEDEPFETGVSYHIEYVFNYAKGSVEVFLDGERTDKADLPSDVNFDPTKLSKFEIYTYSISNVNSPQYIDNISVEKIILPEDWVDEDADDRVLYLSEDFEALEEGDINGQGDWSVSQGSLSVAEVISNEGNKALSFYRTDKDDSQRIVFAPEITETVSFEENDKLSVSFDLMTSAKSGSSGRLYYINLGDGKQIAIDIDGGRVDALTDNYLYLQGSYKALNSAQPYHLELLFDYAAGKVEAFLDGSKVAESTIKSGAGLDPLQLSKFEIFTYSISNYNSPQYIDNIKVEKVIPKDVEEPGEGTDKPEDEPEVSGEVVYLNEDFEDLEEGDINGQGDWSTSQGSLSVAEVISNEGNKALSFYRTGKDDSQTITFAPAINKTVYFNENDKLSVSFDIVTSAKSGTSGRLILFELGDGNRFSIDIDGGRADAATTDYLYLQGSYKALSTNQAYHIELVFDYKASKVEAYLDGIFVAESAIKDGVSLDPTKLCKFEIFTYSISNHNSPQYIDNIKVAKIEAPVASNRVTYLNEDFEKLSEGDINGQGSWATDQGDMAVAEVVTKNESKMLSFYRTSQDNSQYITFSPSFKETVSFGENDKLSVSFDFIASAKSGTSGRLFMFDLGDGNRFSLDVEGGRADAATTDYLYLQGSYKAFNTDQPYRIELVFDYAANKVEAYLNGAFAAECAIKDGVTLDPSKLCKFEIFTYSISNHNSPQYLDNIKVEKIMDESEEPGENPEEPEEPEEPGEVEDLGPSEEGRVLYIAENFERLSTGAINGQGSWKAEQANLSKADVVKKNGSKMLSFYRTGQDNSQTITLSPYMSKEVSFDEDDKLAVSFDFITSAKSGSSGRMFMFEIGDGNRISIDVEGGRSDAQTENYLYFNGGSGAFSTNQTYHIELIFDYKAGKVEGWLDGVKKSESKIKEGVKLDPSKLSMFQIYTYSISNHNSPQYLDNIRIEKIIGAPYLITSVTADEHIIVNVKMGEAEEGAKLIVSSYDASGKLIGIDMGDVEASFVSDLTLNGASTVKAVIFGEEINPLCKNYEGKVVKGQLVNVEDLDYVTSGSTLTVYKPMSSYTSFEDTPWAEETGIKNVVVAENGLLASVPANAFTGFSELETIEIPETVNSVSEDAFPDKAFTVYGCKNTAASEYADAAGKDFFVSKLRVLGIGNSHTYDYSQWKDLIFKDIEQIGAARIEFSKVCFGGAGMYTSAATFDGYTHAHYVYGTNPGSSRNYVYAEALDNDTFDVILIQDYCESTYGREDFLEGISKTMAWLKGKQPQAKVGWVADWVDRNQANNPDDVEAVQSLYYNNTVRLVEEVMSQATVKPDFIVPMGTATQNIRTSYLGSVRNAADCYTNYSNNDWIGSAEKIVNYTLLERDGTHCSYELGRYAMGATVYAWLFDYFKDELKGGDIDFIGALKTAPITEGVEEWKGEFTDSIWDIIKETAENVLANNWTITNSAYTTDPASLKAQEVVNADYSDFTADGIVKTIKSLGKGFTVNESDVKISGDSATVRFLYGYTENTVTISK